MDRIVCWNVRGMNSPQKQEDIRLFLHKHSPGMVCFIETKVLEENMAQVVGRVCNNWQWAHNADIMNKVRVLVCWHPQRYHFQVLFQTDQLIHGKAMQLSTNKQFYITFAYGRNLEAQRIPVWDDLASISINLDNPWCVLGDFNSVLKPGERIGGNAVTESELAAFGDCLTQCGL